MPTYCYTTDHAIAEKTEQEIACFLERVYHITDIHFNATNEYDIIAQYKGTQVTFEIKEDFTCERTGNVGVEFECRGKPSGISTSKATFYVHKIHTRNFGVMVVVHKTKTIKELIENHKYIATVNGGDSFSNSLSYLFKYEEFIKNAVLVKGLKTWMKILVSICTLPNI